VLELEHRFLFCRTFLSVSLQTIRSSLFFLLAQFITNVFEKIEDKFKRRSFYGILFYVILQLIVATFDTALFSSNYNVSTMEYN